MPLTPKVAPPPYLSCPASRPVAAFALRCPAFPGITAAQRPGPLPDRSARPVLTRYPGMISFPRPQRSRPASRLTLRALEDRTTPAAASYFALTQTLTVVAAQADQLVVSAVPNKPTGYLSVTE